MWHTGRSSIFHTHARPYPTNVAQTSAVNAFTERNRKEEPATNAVQGQLASVASQRKIRSKKKAKC